MHLHFARHESLTHILRKQRRHNIVGLGGSVHDFLLSAADDPVVEDKDSRGEEENGKCDRCVYDGIGRKVLVLHLGFREHHKAVSAVVQFCLVGCAECSVVDNIFKIFKC